jgi:uncharacterized membrane protein
MHPISKNFFGQYGIPCVYASGTGYIVKQLGTNKYLVSNGSSIVTCSLAQSSSDISDINNIPDGLMTILIANNGIVIENVNKLQTQAFTLDENIYSWSLPSIVKYNNPYTLHYFPDIANATAIFTPLACNSNGTMFAGYFGDANGVTQAVSYSNGSYTQLTHSLSLGCYASDISSNGHVVVGSAVGTGNAFSQAAYWTNGVVTLLPYLAGADTNPFDAGDASYVQECSADGSVIIGGSRTANTSINGVAVYWKNNQIHDLTTANGISAITTNTIINSNSYNCSSDGTIIVGTINDLQNVYSVVWNISNGITITEIASLGGVGAISGDGTVITGEDNNGNACYLKNGVLTYFPYFSDSDEVFPSFASYNANTIIGSVYVASLGSEYGVSWESNGIVKLNTTPDYPLSTPYAVSSDGKTIAGLISNSDSSLNQSVYWKKP